MAEREEELKGLLMRVKEESEKAGLKLNIKKTKIMATSLITSWQTEWEKATDFIFLGSRITLNSYLSHDIKTLAPWKKSYDKLSIFKSRDITLPTKVYTVKAMVFQ